MGWSLNTLLAEMLSAAGVTGGELGGREVR